MKTEISVDSDILKNFEDTCKKRGKNPIDVIETLMKFYTICDGRIAIVPSKE